MSTFHLSPLNYFSLSLLPPEPVHIRFVHRLKTKGLTLLGRYGVAFLWFCMERELWVAERLSLGSSWGEVGTWGSQMPWTRKAGDCEGRCGQQKLGTEEESFCTPYVLLGRGEWVSLDWQGGVLMTHTIRQPPRGGGQGSWDSPSFAVWPWGSNSTFLNHSFLKTKMLVWIIHS